MILGLVVALVVGLALHATPYGAVVGVVALLAGGSAFLGRASRGQPALRWVLLGALAARVLVAALDNALHLFPKVDALGYHREAAALADAVWSLKPWTTDASSSIQAYARFVGAFYVVFGPSEMLARTASAVLGAVSVLFVHRIGSTLFPERAALAGTVAYAFLPSIVELQGETLRDPLVILLLMGLLLFVAAAHYRNPRWWPFAILALVALDSLRTADVGVLAAALVLTAAVLAWRRYGLRRWVRGHRGASAAAGLVLLLLAWLVVRHFLPSPHALTFNRANWAIGGSAYLVGLRFTSWWQVVAFVPLGAFYFLFTPFPWQVNNALAAAAFAENLVWYWPLAALSWWGWRPAVRQAGGVAVLSFFVVGATAYGLIEGNVGTVIRHRVQFTWVLLVLAGPGLSIHILPRLARLRDRLVGRADPSKP